MLRIELGNFFCEEFFVDGDQLANIYHRVFGKLGMFFLKQNITWSIRKPQIGCDNNSQNRINSTVVEFIGGDSNYWSPKTRF